MATRETLTELALRFRRGEFDTVEVGPSHLSDSHWVTKVREGRYEEIIPYTTDVLTKIAEGGGLRGRPSCEEVAVRQGPACVAD